MHQQLGDRFDELRREQAETAALVESMVEGVIAADERGRIVTANPAARRLLGYEPAMPLPDLPELFRVKAAREVVDAVLRGQAVQDRELEMDGRSFLMNARPLPSGGAVLVIHDLTEIRRLEAMRRDFVANVSHELKTPLTSISGYAETLLTDTPDPETTRRFPRDHPGQRPPDAAAGGRPARPGPDRGGTLAAGARSRWMWRRRRGRPGPSWRSGPRRGAVEFEVDVGARRRRQCCADADALRQVLTNLLDNSLRYTPPGGRIVCRSRREDGGVAISVSDTGIGHRPRASPPDLRAVLPGGSIPVSRGRRHRVGTRHREAPGGGARRQGLGRERAGRRDHGHLLVPGFQDHLRPAGDGGDRRRPARITGHSLPNRSRKAVWRLRTSRMFPA